MYDRNSKCKYQNAKLRYQKFFSKKISDDIIVVPRHQNFEL